MYLFNLTGTIELNKMAGFIPVIAALIAGIVALKQARLNNISAARIKWLENLKVLIGECIRLTSSFLIFNQVIRKSSNVDDDIKHEHARKFIDSLHDLLQEMSKNVMLISLNLNKSEILPQILLLKLTELMGSLGQIQNEDFLSQTSLLLMQIEDISSHILKIEWEKTKSQRIKFMTLKQLNNYTKQKELASLSYLTEEQKFKIKF